MFSLIWADVAIHRQLLVMGLGQNIWENNATKLNDSGCKCNAKQKFTNRSCTEDSANVVCSLNAGKPSPPKVMKIDTNYKPKNKWKCYSNFELHFSLKVNKIYASTVKPHKLHN